MGLIVGGAVGLRVGLMEGDFDEATEGLWLRLLLEPSEGEAVESKVGL